MIVDTDIISYYLRGNLTVKEAFVKNQQNLASTSVNYAELVFGLKKRDNRSLLPIVEKIFDNITIYTFDRRAAKLFGELKAAHQPPPEF